ncbi:MAG: ribonuclease III [Candidatus Niyogibacteria bacterium RIFCSPLOWO2_12_FULL_41_13]|uniref:Ribonuclease 3 n=1 Tax=Candidatus Niyogibacteria bacterium RIFCSPLOWO2_12_FULL_41_13 TaxID=1801726 RepID=A0A1G2F3A2_9BACT|nr:MAG: ribonuclease III [Candidatus Niyogibacteria bacterium RIFCSPLOWO2_12_FULL_41_13]
MKHFKDFAEKIGVSFKNEDLLKQAFTHRSYLNENPDWITSHNERLEFLGDAVLELAASDFLFKKFPQKPEGELTSLRAALVNADSLAESAEDLDINNYLLLSRGEAKDVGRGRLYILANTYEAIIGAIYLDQGYGPAEKFIEKTLLLKIEEVLEKGLYRDAKSMFQEKSQEIVQLTPAYKVLEEWGPDHDKQFRVGVFLGEELVAEGEGPSKQLAEQEAAKSGLKIKKWD